MSEQLGKIEKPPVKDFKLGRKLCLVPLIFHGRDPEPEYLEKFDKYWKQVEEQLENLEGKLGKFTRIYHEMIPVTGEPGIKALRELNEKSSQLIEKLVKKGAQLEAAEEVELLAEYMDWSRILAIGFESQKAFVRVYELYQEISKERSEYMANQIDETLKADEIGVLFITEGHKVQFPTDIQVFYVSPPALDEIERWLRELRAEAQKKQEEQKHEEESHEEKKD